MLEKHRKKILTVGDGDLTLSLALSRAYGDYVDVTASVLESDRRKFLRVFPEAPLEELHKRQVPVLYGIDATRLHLQCASLEEVEDSEKSKVLKAWDLVCFHHPHLGSNTLEKDSESTRALLHYRLLCHYLHSAKQISDLVHVCLTGSQPTTWSLMRAAKAAKLELIRTLSDSRPFANVWMDMRENDSTTNIGNDPKILPEAAKAEPHFAAPRKYRNGKLGRHSLARYGYRHRRTEGVLFKGSTKDANVSESMHFVFADKYGNNRQEKGANNGNGADSNLGKAHVCEICDQSFPTECALKEHLISPVRHPSNPDAKKPRNSSDEHQGSQLRNKAGKTFDAKCFHPCVVDPSRSALSKSDHDERPGTILLVSSDCHGKRLRWFLQHSKLNSYKFSKRLAESTIQAGLVLVNGQVALDSSRILQIEDKVTVLKLKEARATDEHTSGQKIVPKSVVVEKSASANPRVEILKRSSSPSLKWLVALKPSGMRAKGKMTGTLESAVSVQEEMIYNCLSSLETSCSGLCVLVNTTHSETEPSQSHNDIKEVKISVMHTLTVLVHGEIPRETWSPSRTVPLTLESKWRQKRRDKKRKYIPESCSKPSEDAQFQNTTQRVVSAEIHFKESKATVDKNFPGNNTGLSTVQVITPEPSSRSICHFLRHEGFPVVGDAFCKQEYNKLKRSIRNRLKNKLCIGCFRVEIKVIDAETDGATKELTTTHVVAVPSPNKLSAIFWGNFSEEDTHYPGQVQN